MTRATSVAALTLTLVAGQLAARDITLGLPVDCDLGNTCYIQQYVDHDPSRDAMDFRCSSLSYDAHNGTDFALNSLAAMDSGVNVIAAAPGVVRATRDGVKDQIYTPELASSLSGRECGNGVVIDHEDGWSTQYCHLKRGSIAVRKGQRVSAATILGQVGLSGRTQFPHLDLTVRRNGDIIDPFDPDGRISCDTPSQTTLWKTPPTYQPGGVLSVGFADHVPAYIQIKEGRAAFETLPVTARALVVFGYAFGGKKGDIMVLRIEGPGGVITEKSVLIKREHAQFFRAVGKKRRKEWTRGMYRGTVTLQRGNSVVSTKTSTVVIR